MSASMVKKVLFLLLLAVTLLVASVAAQPGFDGWGWGGPTPYCCPNPYWSPYSYGGFGWALPWGGWF